MHLRKVSSGMLLHEVLRVAFASLRANKLRSLLTMLGIVIGVASVITMIALGTGAENAVNERIAKILVPLTTGRFQLFGTDRLQDIWVRAINEASIGDAMFETQMALRRSHKIPQGRPDDFTMRNQSDFLAVLSETTATFTALLAGVARCRFSSAESAS
jgi:hypothetical protein